MSNAIQRPEGDQLGSKASWPRIAGVIAASAGAEILDDDPCVSHAVRARGVRDLPAVGREIGLDVVRPGRVRDVASVRTVAVGHEDIRRALPWWDAVVGEAAPVG